MEMMTWVAVLAALVLLVVGMIKRQKSNKAPDIYICSQCDEKDCDCTKQAKGRGGPEHD
jgi:hypothetical protein